MSEPTAASSPQKSGPRSSYATEGVCSPAATYHPRCAKPTTSCLGGSTDTPHCRTWSWSAPTTTPSSNPATTLMLTAGPSNSTPTDNPTSDHHDASTPPAHPATTNDSNHHPHHSGRDGTSEHVISPSRAAGEIGDRAAPEALENVPLRKVVATLGDGSVLWCVDPSTRRGRVRDAGAPPRPRVSDAGAPPRPRVADAGAPPRPRVSDAVAQGPATHDHTDRLTVGGAATIRPRSSQRSRRAAANDHSDGPLG